MQLPEFVQKLDQKELLELVDLLTYISRCGRITNRNKEFWNDATPKEYIISLLESIARSQEKP